MMLDWIQWMGHAFSPEQYIFWTRIECTVWTLADVVLVYTLLRIADLARHVIGSAPHRISYAVFVATLPLAAAIPFAPSGRLIFLLELFVTVPHFLIIVYVLLCDARPGAAALATLIPTAPERTPTS